MTEIADIDNGLIVVSEPQMSVDRAPGFGWTLSAEARDAIRDIDANIRAAEQMSGRLVVG